MRFLGAQYEIPRLCYADIKLFVTLLAAKLPLV